MNAKMLILLTDVEGVYNKHPDEAGAKVRKVGRFFFFFFFYFASSSFDFCLIAHSPGVLCCAASPPSLFPSSFHCSLRLALPLSVNIAGANSM